MAPALAELPEDDEEGQSAEVSGSAPSTTARDKQPSESSSFSLARAETLMICYSKVLVLIVIAIFAAAIGTVTYFLVYSQEDSEYHAKVSTNHWTMTGAVYSDCWRGAAISDNLLWVHLLLVHLLLTTLLSI